MEQIIFTSRSFGGSPKNPIVFDLLCPTSLDSIFADIVLSKDNDPHLPFRSPSTIARLIRIRSNNTTFARIRRLEQYDVPNTMARLNTLLSTLPPLSIPPRPTPLTVLSTFTLFPKLAPELRDMIWKYAASEPRTVRLFTIDGTLGTTDPSQTLKVSGQSKHPGIFQACRESREAAMGIYEKCWVTVISNIDGLLDRDTIYVNFAVDRFFFQMSRAPTVNRGGLGARDSTFNFTPGHFKQIQNLQLELSAGLWIDRTLWNLLGCSNIASVWFTNFDWAKNHPVILNFETVRCLEENYWNDCCLMEMLKKTGLLLPELEFHSKATEETALWPCAPIDNYNSSAETRIQLFP